MRQQLTRETQEWLCVPDRGYTSHIVVMRGYMLYIYRKGAITSDGGLRGYTINVVSTGYTTVIYYSVATAAYQENP